MELNFADDSLALHTDAYQLSMMQTYFDQGIHDRHAVYEMYFRKLPFENGYAIFAGLERIIEYLRGLHFSDTDIAYLRETGNYSEAFIDYLAEWRFRGTVRAPREGEPVFNNEPILQVEGPVFDAQLIETALLNIVNYQTLIATKASRIRSVVGDQALMEFGTRRAQELDAALWGTRAAYIGGFDATSNVRAGKLFGIPIAGTHAHSLVQIYRSDYEAFKAYAESHRDCVFLVDTYDTLRSGVPAAIKVAREFGDKINFLGVRIDSGDMAYLSKGVRKMLDEAGFPEAKIYASNDLDEETITSLKRQDAKIDVWGIGTKLITAYDQPALGGVYKVVSIENERGKMVDTIKISGTAAKISTPGKKQVWRITSNADGKSEGDYIALWDENPKDNPDGVYMFNPNYPYLNKTIKDYTARPLLHDVIVDGEVIYESPDLATIRKYSQDNLQALWAEYRRDLNPQEYPVDLSKKAWQNKMNLIEEVQDFVKRIAVTEEALPKDVDGE
ncbi:nicotinate phosphoribosyltransferase [Weissella tructae]|uniref:Nicotinate phosphoribosyltransferase n=2 Tax=Weissella TaxID=46255 RepID=A0A075U0D8_9LACO|nr:MULTISPECIES: nicotinate phosphoribosyltransferase [Weissella]AIG66005.1 Nicotinate phosphoribosyltransferase [Weissella tructae]AIM63385.1 Nicotinate phosphoribosyltransferase [Weissella ceti]AIM64719.1 Nicotinate phosphoribosyltransferase [Weissella ceti]ELA07376.1 nicotinate phosphoribosyltransferase [Weissella ceti NC36]QVV91159.1 nicotinate phosphoribosyltransferase [Weissella tructae]